MNGKIKTNCCTSPSSRVSSAVRQDGPLTRGPAWQRFTHTKTLICQWCWLNLKIDSKTWSNSSNTQSRKSSLSDKIVLLYPRSSVARPCFPPHPPSTSSRLLNSKRTGCLITDLKPLTLFSQISSSPNLIIKQEKPIVSSGGSCPSSIKFIVSLNAYSNSP